MAFVKNPEVRSKVMKNINFAFPTSPMHPFILHNSNSIHTFLMKEFSADEWKVDFRVFSNIR